MTDEQWREPPNPEPSGALAHPEPAAADSVPIEGPPGARMPVLAHYHDTDCSEFLLRIYEYMDGEMGPEENLRFEAHVRECPPCLRQHQVDQTVRSLIRRVEPTAVAPETLRASIVARITTIRFESSGF